MKNILFFVLFFTSEIKAQELFVATEPASNMPKNSIGIRLGNYLMKEPNPSKYDYQLTPEVMWGANKNLMLHADFFLSSRSKSFTEDGFSFYGKYRFLANDEVHKHFRMAAFGRISLNRTVINHEDIDLYGNNSGYQVGVVATQLLHKVALSASSSFIKAINNGNNNKFPETQSQNATDYTFSFGKLLLPKQYTDYHQTNLNLMIEFLGQTLFGSGKSYIDIAPSLQFIFNSQSRIDIGYRNQLYSSMHRIESSEYIVRFEYLIFNAVR